METLRGTVKKGRVAVKKFWLRLTSVYLNFSRQLGVNSYTVMIQVYGEFTLLSYTVCTHLMVWKCC